MADNESRRTIQKRRLRGNLIDRDARVEVVERRPASAILVLVLITLALIGVFLIYRSQTFTARSASVVWEKEIGDGNSVAIFRDFGPLDGGVIMYTKDGAEYTDRSGRSIWQKSYQMNNPCINVRGKHAVIYDLGGTAACIFSEEQNTGNIATVMPISKMAVAGTGVTYAVENDDNADFLMVYRKDGSAIDLTVKSVMNGDGYPFDIAVSPDGTQLLTSYIAISDGSVKESVVFRNFGEVGQNADARRVVGGFIDEFDGHLVTKVGFADDTCSHAFYDGGIVFFSTKVLNSPEIIQKVEIGEQILSVADCSKGVAVITAPAEGEEKEKLLIYDNNGRLTGSAELEIEYTGFIEDDANVILYSADRIQVYSHKGRLLADLNWSGRIASVVGTGRARELIIAESGRFLYVKAE